MAGGRVPWGWMGEEKKLRNQGQGPFCGQERNPSRLPSALQVCSPNGEPRPSPRGKEDAAPVATPGSPYPGPHPSQRAELEATMAASNLEAVSPPRQRGAASNPHPLVCFYFIPRSLSLPHQEVIFNTILLTGLLGDYVKHLEQSPVRSKCHSYWFHKGNSAFIEVRNRVPSFIHSAVLLSIYSDNQ